MRVSRWSIRYLHGIISKNGVSIQSGENLGRLRSTVIVGALGILLNLRVYIVSKNMSPTEQHFHEDLTYIDLNGSPSSGHIIRHIYTVVSRTSWGRSFFLLFLLVLCACFESVGWRILTGRGGQCLIAVRIEADWSSKAEQEILRRYLSHLALESLATGGFGGVCEKLLRALERCAEMIESIEMYT